MWLSNVHPFLLLLLLHTAANWRHDMSHTFHPIIQLPASPNQQGAHIAENMSIWTVLQGKGCQPHTLFNSIKDSKYAYTYSIYSLLFSFVTIISDPLGFRSTWYVCNYKDKTTITIMKLFCILLLSNNVLLYISKLYSEIVYSKRALCTREYLVRFLSCYNVTHSKMLLKANHGYLWVSIILYIFSNKGATFFSSAIHLLRN